MAEYTKGLASYIANLKFEDIPADAVDCGKMLTLHCAGVALAAKGQAPVTSGIASASDLGSRAENMATLWGVGKAPLMGTIVANTTASDTLDWEDCSWTGHPTASMVPVALSMCEAYKKTGRDYLTAMIGGFEVYQRIAGFIQPPKGWDHVKHGWGLGTWQIFASSIPAGKVLGCDETQFNQLIGGSGCMTPVVNTIAQKNMSDFYHQQFGFVSLNGAMLAQMAKRNELVGLHDLLDMEGGYSMMMRGFANEGWLDRNIGTEYMLKEILFKHWPANMWVQAPLDCMDSLCKEHSFTIDDIESVYITPGIQFRNKYCPDGYKSMMECQFSTAYMLAVYMLDYTPGPHWFSKDMLKNPKLLEMAGRVKMNTEEVLLLSECFALFTDGTFPKITMTVTLKNGAVLKRDFQYPKGHPQNPYDWDEARRDFHIGAQVSDLPAEKAEKFIAMCKDLENVANVAEMAECLAP